MASTAAGFPVFGVLVGRVVDPVLGPSVITILIEYAVVRWLSKRSGDIPAARVLAAVTIANVLSITTLLVLLHRNMP